MQKFPKIGRIDSALYNLAKLTPRPKHVLYRGTVKIHGCNVSIKRYRQPGEAEYTYEYFSRNRKLDPVNGSDQYGFGAYCLSHAADLAALFEEVDLYNVCGTHEAVTLYGEWFGPGVQKGVGVNNLAGRYFSSFAVRVGDEATGRWGVMPERIGVNVAGDVLAVLTLDAPHAFANNVDRVTVDVGAKCPMAEHLGVEGPGEGLVWVPVRSDLAQNPAYWFKSKARSFEESTTRAKAKATAKSKRDPFADAEARGFVHQHYTDVRLNKGIDYLTEMDMPLDRTSTGKFILWVHADVMAEHKEQAVQLPLDQIRSYGAKTARLWYFEHLTQRALEA